MTPYYSESGITLYVGDCLEVLPTLPPESVDAIVTDPPYHLTTIGRSLQFKEGKRRRSAGFMGKDWDGGDIAFRPEVWEAALRVAKPGAHLLAFGGTRTSHRLVCAIEDAGWEIRDTLMWVYGSGFPKSLDVSKAIDKEAGVERAVLSPRRGVTKTFDVGCTTTIKPRDPITAPATEAAKQWDGWGTALKPAVEPIVLARKPLIGTVAGNVQRYGTGALNIDGCRIGTETITTIGSTKQGTAAYGDYAGMTPKPHTGRWPANLIHDGSPEVVECFPEAAPSCGSPKREQGRGGVFGGGAPGAIYRDDGNASRFFYCAKASRADRYSEAGNDHPTVKPLALVQYLIRLITPSGGLVLDPFSGSGTTPKAARDLGFRCIAIDLEERHQEIAKHRLNQTVLDLGA